MNLRVWLILFMACLGDIAVWSLMGTPVSSFILSLWYALIGMHSSEIAITVVGILSLVQLFILTGSVGTDLLIMVPLGLLWYYCLRMATLPRPLLACAIFGAVVLQRFLLEGLLAGGSFGSYHMVGAFISSVSVVYLYSGSQGNRSRL